MENTRVYLRRECYCCSICLELLKDPVSLHCGHNYCKVCVEGHSHSEAFFYCPQCRQTLREKPILQKNTLLAELVKTLEQTGPADVLCCAGPEDVACDVCTGSKLKAIKSCLVCLVSFCEEHVQPHLESPAFSRHKLLQPSKQLQGIICSDPDEEKIFCRTDQQVICYCAADRHQDHDVLPATVERKDREKDLNQGRRWIQQSIQRREMYVKDLLEEDKNLKVSADKAVKDSHQNLKQMIQILHKRMSDEEEQIRNLQKIEAKQFRELQGQLKQEISELRRQEAEMQNMSLTENLGKFLQNLASQLEDSEDSLSSRIHGRSYNFDDTTAEMSTSRNQLKDAMRRKCMDISLMYAPEARSRNPFCGY